MPAWDSIDRGTQHILATFAIPDLDITEVMDDIITDGYWLPSLTVTIVGITATTGSFIRLSRSNGGVNYGSFALTADITADGTYAIELADNISMPRILSARWISGDASAGTGTLILYMKRLPL